MWEREFRLDGVKCEKFSLKSIPMNFIPAFGKLNTFQQIVIQYDPQLTPIPGPRQHHPQSPSTQPESS